MGKIISLEYISKTIDYFRSLGIDIHDRDPYERLHDYGFVRRVISNDKELSKGVKKGIREVIGFLENVAQKLYFDKGYGL